MADVDIKFTCAISGQPELTHDLGLSQSDFGRILAAFQGPANIMVNGTATQQQVLDCWLQKVVIEGTNAVVVAHEKQKAIEAIKDPAPITPA